MTPNATSSPSPHSARAILQLEIRPTPTARVYILRDGDTQCLHLRVPRRSRGQAPARIELIPYRGWAESNIFAELRRHPWPTPESKRRSKVANALWRWRVLRQDIPRPHSAPVG